MDLDGDEELNVFSKVGRPIIKVVRLANCASLMTSKAYGSER